MKLKNIFLLFCCTFVFMTLSCATVQSKQRKTAKTKQTAQNAYPLAIEKVFTLDSSDESKEMAQYIQEFLITDFKNYSSISIIDKDHISELLDMQADSESGIYSEKTMIQAGKLKNARWIIKGQLSKMDRDGFHTLVLRGIDIETGEILAHFSKKYPPEYIRHKIATKEAIPVLFKGFKLPLSAEAEKELKRYIQTTKAELDKKRKNTKPEKVEDTPLYEEYDPRYEPKYEQRYEPKEERKEEPKQDTSKAQSSLTALTFGGGYISSTHPQHNANSIDYVNRDPEFIQKKAELIGFHLKSLTMVAPFFGTLSGITAGIASKEIFSDWIGLQDKKFLFSAQVSVAFPFVLSFANIFGFGIGPGLNIALYGSESSAPVIISPYYTKKLVHKDISTFVGLGGSALMFVNFWAFTLHAGIDVFYNVVGFSWYEYTLGNEKQEAFVPHLSIIKDKSWSFYPYLGIGLVF